MIRLGAQSIHNRYTAEIEMNKTSFEALVLLVVMVNASVAVPPRLHAEEKIEEELKKKMDQELQDKLKKIF